MDILSFLLGKNSSGGGGGGGVDLNKYINLAPSVVESPTNNWWSESFTLSDMSNAEIVANTNKFTYMFYGCKWVYIPKVSTNGTINNLFLNNMFQNCSNVTSLDLSGMIGSVGRISNTFNGCSSLQHLDIRNLVLHDASLYSATFNSVPSDCEIIVKNVTEKMWLASNFSSLSNVKTVEDYEA